MPVLDATSRGIELPPDLDSLTEEIYLEAKRIAGDAASDAELQRAVDTVAHRYLRRIDRYRALQRIKESHVTSVASEA